VGLLIWVPAQLGGGGQQVAARPVGLGRPGNDLVDHREQLGAEDRPIIRLVAGVGAGGPELGGSRRNPQPRQVLAVPG
jgi:hypothetical protein